MTEEEIGRRKKRGPSLDIVVGLLVWMLVTFGLAAINFRRNKFVSSGPILVDSWAQYLAQIPLAAILATILALIAVGVSRKQKPTLVCPDCGIIKDADGILTCTCGGRFHDAQTMKWIEDEQPH